ncbi:helix-turn-helix transcriptional regulator [Magnetospira sp. QH-2]|uniref:ArsR/SmtB family transcription factor n=1 Tax=Magnetospira sp. (strain QH-2) TaxID=1288970 RepID=UPI0003E81A4F|nr:metalloregulator ArsR/SmtB family transcription factor [Magnetospira sp. QH-2]CCQ73847.1 putative transcriptional regulatory protein, Ars family [Magnetospira sp. QH-2]
MAVVLADLETNARLASGLLKAMSNERRLLILCQLVHGERTVSQLEDVIGLSQSALSQHLAVLRQNDLVKTRREAQSIYYSLAGPAPKAVIETLYGLFGKNTSCDPENCA